MTREDVTQLLHKSEGFNKDSRTLDFNDSGKIDHLSEISDYKSLDNILGEFYRIQKLMNDLFLKDMAFLSTYSFNGKKFIMQYFMTKT